MSSRGSRRGELWAVTEMDRGNRGRGRGGEMGRDREKMEGIREVIVRWV